LDRTESVGFAGLVVAQGVSERLGRGAGRGLVGLVADVVLGIVDRVADIVPGGFDRVLRIVLRVTRAAGGGGEDEEDGECGEYSAEHGIPFGGWMGEVRGTDLVPLPARSGFTPERTDLARIGRPISRPRGPDR